MKEIAKICEVTYPRPAKDKSMPQRSILHLYEQIRNSKNKAECGAAIRFSGWIPWNDMPPDIREKLNKFFPKPKDEPEKP